ncbi:MAG: peptidase C39 family protein, partial [Candidatus Bathyarchaeia archaeon]
MGKKSVNIYPSLNVPYYAQTAEFSCGPACALMVLEYFDGIRVSRELEFEVWREVNLIGVPGCDCYGLALALHRMGLGVRIFVEGRIMSNSLKIIERRFGKGSAELTRFALDHFLDKSVKLGLRVDRMLPSNSEVIDALKSNMVPVFMVYMHSAPHWVVVKGLYRGGYVINDP